jgi:hypothetical protein
MAPLSAPKPSNLKNGMAPLLPPTKHYPLCCLQEIPFSYSEKRGQQGWDPPFLRPGKTHISSSLWIHRPKKSPCHRRSLPPRPAPETPWDSCSGTSHSAIPQEPRPRNTSFRRTCAGHRKAGVLHPVVTSQSIERHGLIASVRGHPQEPRTLPTGRLRHRAGRRKLRPLRLSSSSLEKKGA